MSLYPPLTKPGDGLIVRSTPEAAQLTFLDTSRILQSLSIVATPAVCHALAGMPFTQVQGAADGAVTLPSGVALPITWRETGAA